MKNIEETIIKMSIKLGYPTALYAINMNLLIKKLVLTLKL
ncbi:hypothetical protein H311_00982 [Anncaliia algerae PRA109]|nr:hypothetical protein H311_00982 [Anncaliia algerae PRA109]